MTMTYTTFFELKDRPFRLSPDTEYFFPSEVHKEIMRHLLYSINTEEGFVEIIGEPGIGKTITLRSLIKQIGEEVLISIIVNPTISPNELLKAVALDFGVKQQDMENQSGEHILRLIQIRLMYLSEKGSVAVIVIDEAQNLNDKALEQVCLISNIEIDQKKAVKVILVGQLELGKNLQRPELLKIYQRITIRARLAPLSLNDTYLYIQHRIRVAGGTEFRQPKFPKKVIKQIYYYSNGLPRIINIICERCLMAAFNDKKKRIKSSHVKQALKSFQPKENVAKIYKRNVRIRNGLFIIFFLLAGWFSFPNVYNIWINNQKKIDQLLYTNTSVKEEDPSNKTSKAKEAWVDHKKKINDLLQKKNKSQDNRENLSNKGNEDNLSIDVKKDIDTDTHDASTAISKQTVSDSSVVKNDLKSNVFSQETQIQDSDHVFPHKLMTTSFKQKIIIYYSDINQMVVWNYVGKLAKLINKADFYANLREGVYLLGREKNNNPFLFNPFIHGNNISKQLPEKFCQQFGDILPGQIIPVLVYSYGKSFKHPVYDKTKTSCSIVEKWANAWRSKNIDEFINFYHKDDIVYYKIGKDPMLIPWEKLKTTKAVTFEKINDVELKISQLICITDPGNPKTAITMFYQKYSSRNYSDEGIKVLFLSQAYDLESSSDNYIDQQPDWRITGRFWLSIR